MLCQLPLDPSSMQRTTDCGRCTLEADIDRLCVRWDDTMHAIFHALLAHLSRWSSVPSARPAPPTRARDIRTRPHRSLPNGPVPCRAPACVRRLRAKPTSSPLPCASPLGPLLLPWAFDAPTGARRRCALKAPLLFGGAGSHAGPHARWLAPPSRSAVACKCSTVVVVGRAHPPARPPARHRRCFPSRSRLPIHPLCARARTGTIGLPRTNLRCTTSHVRRGAQERLAFGAASRLRRFAVHGALDARSTMSSAGNAGRPRLSRKDKLARAVACCRQTHPPKPLPRALSGLPCAHAPRRAAPRRECRTAAQRPTP